MSTMPLLLRLPVDSFAEFPLVPHMAQAHVSLLDVKRGRRYLNVSLCSAGISSAVATLYQKHCMEF